MKNKRTKDLRFYLCPYCQKPPREFYLPPNYGWAYCDGTFFRPHKKIRAETGMCNPSDVMQKLVERWNQEVLKVNLGKEND